MARSPLAAALSATAALSALPAAARADALSDARAPLAKYSSRVVAWDGPTTGRKAVPGKTVVVLAGDMKNGGISGVTGGSVGVFEAPCGLHDGRALDREGRVAGRPHGGRRIGRLSITAQTSLHALHVDRHPAGW